MSDFMSVIKERRSATKFVQGVEISQQELADLFSLTKFAPSAFNLQHTHYVAVTDPARKEGIYEAANKQYKVKTASAVILVLGDTKAYQQAGQLNEGLLNLGVLSKQEYDMTVQSTMQFYEKRGEAFQREEAIRNASLSAMQFMLIAKAKGWDTCPMIGFDPGAVRNLFNIPERYIPVLLITLGKEDVSNQRPRGYRKPISEFVTYNSF
ncbi:nitroreductase family protein [Aneurinibacillus aneurinilyticus]|jgi:putative NAD(P)H nitroreductase|uniref:Nitroreductase family protein n=2 Tax=Aneurinibacillus aneurinilyticus TaxID=1391 RepID=A0A848CU15_ANEAE|nr:nitroreductase family protein [Aneurinibacillus aneurinilyticus]ERI05629.1 nitroreductase family protein [Aneurinibacillus aneurinilyticus ATCC 12856]MCI1696093.1 nitroreductase family protein [Aneurinibacillus aneurinilyticus]MED0672845.1 nitroreductase family protein [Aneurinibacillus aneurinilyticus]MED0706257.1 nitroreductase family protein [Aneurinibacillus aneurinilyticus]MED0724211.1 nitroreductase family protein [Aneurinibacillus aneurinilyticus]